MTKNKLFIIGNGFDLHLKLPTSYYDFKKFIEEKFESKSSFSLCDLYGEDEICNLWKDLEAQIGYVNEISINDISGYSKFGNIDNRLRMIEKAVYDSIKELKLLFIEWVKSINLTLHNIKPKKFEFPKDSSIFLSFNYTSTLMDIFNINYNDILYIHNHVNDNNLILGCDSSILDYYKEINDQCNEFTKNGLLETIEKATKDFILKNPKEIWSFKKSFFNTKRIEEVYVLGHSLNSIDEYYFVQIRKLYKDAFWTFSIYSEQDIINANFFVKKLNISNYKIGTMIDILKELY